MAANSGMQARFRYGNVNTTIPYTPSGADVVAGQVVLINNLVGIATRLIPDGEMGGLNIMGGVYLCIGDAAISAGKDVYWDNTNKKVTETRGTNKHLGVTVTACTGDDASCDVFHFPANVAELGS